MDKKYRTNNNPGQARAFLDIVAQLGHDHARSEFEYDKELKQYLNLWLNQISQDQSICAGQNSIDMLKSTLFVQEYAYNTDTTNAVGQVESVERIGRDVVKRLIPISYAVAGMLFFSLSLIFGFTFYLGLHGAGYLIGPWTNLMLLVAAIGMTLTVLAAIFEWRKLSNGWQKGRQG